MRSAAGSVTWWSRRPIPRCGQARRAPGRCSTTSSRRKRSRSTTTGRPREASPAFVAGRSAFFTALAREGLPWPPLDDFGSTRSPAPSREAGLVRAIDPRRRRHVYGVGKRPRGEPVGELGSLVTTAPPDGVPMFFTPEGYLVTDRPADAVRPIRTRSAAARWLLAPLSWRGGDSGQDPPFRTPLRRFAAGRRIEPLALDPAHRIDDRVRVDRVEEEPRAALAHDLAGAALSGGDRRDTGRLGLGHAEPELLDRCRDERSARAVELAELLVVVDVAREGHVRGCGGAEQVELGAPAYHHQRPPKAPARLEDEIGPLVPARPGHDEEVAPLAVVGREVRRPNRRGDHLAGASRQPLHGPRRRPPASR